MEIAEITGKKGRWIRKSGYASINIDGEEQYIGELSKGNAAFTIKDMAGETVLSGLKDRLDIIINHQGAELVKVIAPNGFLSFRRFVIINGKKHQLIQRNVIKLSDYIFTFSRLGLGLKIEKQQIFSEHDVYRGIGLGYYIWMRNDISD